MDETTNMEVLPASAIESLERAHVDVQVATAHQYPRSLKLFRDRALSMACLDEDTADSCIYCRPVGKEKDEKTGEWRQKFAEGASIRLAEIVAASYGNIRVASRIVEQTPRYVRCEGIAHDLESNYAGKSEIVESTVNKNGEPYSERQRALTAKVALSKAYRDAVFKVVPRALAKPVLDAAKKVATGAGKPLTERRKRSQAWIATLKIDEARVFAALNIKGWDDVMDDHLSLLTGIKNALSENDTTIDEAFPPLESDAAKKQDTHKPTATGVQQSQAGKPAATGTTTGTTVAKSTPKQAQDKPKDSTPAETPPAAETPNAAPAAAQGTPSEGQPAQTDEAEESAMGLAPEQSQDVSQENSQETAPEKDQEQGEAQGEPEPDKGAPPATPMPVRGQYDTDQIFGVKVALWNAGASEAQFMAWAKGKGLAKPAQKEIRELASSKLTNVLGNWHNIVAEIKATAV